MADLLNDNTDFEVSKYYDAQEMNDAGFDPAIIKDKKSVFNPESGMNDILTSMPSGGYVKIGEEEPEVMAEAPAQPEMPGMSEAAPAQAAAEEAKRLQEIQGSYSLDDLRAAGYTDQQISAAGLDVQPEPMTEQEVAQYISEGAPLVDADPTLRDQGAQIVSTYVFDAAVAGLRDELAEQGMGPEEIERTVKAREGELFREAEVYSNALFGTGATGYEVGLGDFLTAGTMDIQEGYRMFNQQRGEGGSMAGRAMGAGIMIAGIAEATGVGYAFGKLLKRGIKLLEPEIIRMGEEAQGRIDAEGATLFSNPVGPIVDRGLAAAGRLAESEKPSVDELRRQANIARFGYDPNEAPTIKAFHGSPYSFDRFDLSFMGTGEGAQAYGKGLYFAEMEDVAKEYRDQLSGHLNAKVGDQKVIDVYNDLSAQADRLPIEDAQILYEKMAFLEDLELTSDINLSIDRIDDPEVEAWAKSEVLPKFQPAGNIYEVEIKADPSELLDFDAPISEQPAKVQEAIAPFVERRLDAIEAAGQEALEKAKELGRDFTPKTRSEILSTLKGGDILLLDKVETGEVSQALKDAGVPGIKYLDRQSRGKSFEIKLSVKDKPYATEPIFATNKADAERIANDYKEKGFGATITDVGSNNYVVLDDNLIEIVKKYGFGGLMVGAGVQSGLGVKESFEET